MCILLQHLLYVLKIYSFNVLNVPMSLYHLSFHVFSVSISITTQMLIFVSWLVGWLGFMDLALNNRQRLILCRLFNAKSIFM